MHIPAFASGRYLRIVRASGWYDLLVTWPFALPRTFAWLYAQQNLLAQAENMKDIITIESAISDTELEIERLTGTLRQYDALVDYATSQAKLGEPMGLEELSGLIDEDRPKAFYDHIRNKDYGLSPEIPLDKRTLNQFRRFTGRAEGLSISFEAHLLGDKIEYDEASNSLVIKGLPTQLTDQLKRR